MSISFIFKALQLLARTLFTLSLSQTPCAGRLADGGLQDRNFIIHQISAHVVIPGSVSLCSNLENSALFGLDEAPRIFQMMFLYVTRPDPPQWTPQTSSHYKQISYHCLSSVWMEFVQAELWLQKLLASFKRTGKICV